MIVTSPCRSVYRTSETQVTDLIPAQPIFFPRTDYSCDSIHSSITTVLCFDDGPVGKLP